MTDTPENQAAESDGKAEFREALERKARISRSRQANSEGHLKLKGYNGPHGQSRTFRRKAG
ncbi:DUF5302 domain-containing protein [Streptomyces sp. NPDC031705]|uniref:DUF5302 domain-containing protein n=1 Tax=unclassified Streptomyces TaxID=2593676 RepID=UPI0033E1A494